MRKAGSILLKILFILVLAALGFLGLVFAYMNALSTAL